MTRTAWRFRHCPHCGVTNTAGDFRIVGTYRRGWNDRSTLRRRCPSCGVVDRTEGFPVVRQQGGGEQ
jgi:ribosomal protein S27AE